MVVLHCGCTTMWLLYHVDRTQSACTSSTIYLVPFPSDVSSRDGKHPELEATLGDYVQQ